MILYFRATVVQYIPIWHWNLNKILFCIFGLIIFFVEIYIYLHIILKKVNKITELEKTYLCH